jgi:4-methylaminobutanoate oxidase (formaldehyde-forming)
MNIQTNKTVDLLVVGGGIFGASIAYYYKRDNPDKEVVVYEKKELCSGNTSFAAGLLSRVRSYDYVIPLSLETYRVIPELEKLTGDHIPVHYNGAIHLAVSNETVTILENTLLAASKHGISHEDITSEEAEGLVPWLNASEAKKITFIPGEATVDPFLLGMSFVYAAKKIGVRFIRNIEVTDLLKNEHSVFGVKTKYGIQNARVTVLAAGVWSTLLAYKIGISLPMAAVRSQYWITEKSESLFPAQSPAVLIPESNFYSRPQGNALLFGIRESDSLVINPHNLPDEIGDFNFSTDSGWNDLVINYEKLIRFFPIAVRTGIEHYIAGFSAYTPDNLFVVGEIPGINGLLVATGCVGAGISVSGGIGLGIALLAAGRGNPFDFSHYKPDRFGSIDPFSTEHLTLCAKARSLKISG